MWRDHRVRPRAEGPDPWAERTESRHQRNSRAIIGDLDGGLVLVDLDQDGDLGIIAANESDQNRNHANSGTRASMTAVPSVRAADVAWITEADMIEIDRVMIEDLRIELLQMMENAGRNLARLTIDRFGPNRAVVVAGSGGNGGGGMVAARHLSNAGVDVEIVTTRAVSDLAGVPAHQRDILERIEVGSADDVGEADVIVDAVIGYSLRGAPRGRSAELIAQINAAEAPVISLDTPSGLDVTTGDAPGAVVDAAVTMTLCLPKLGLRAAGPIGELYLADISVPPSITAGYGPAPDFSLASVLRVER